MTAAEPTVALVFSPEAWVEELHRHLAHHGGARVRHVVVEPATALDEEYDVLVVSDRWPALTFGLVGAIHAHGRRVLGVFDADEAAGKDHLVALGVDATVPSDARVVEIVGAVRELGAASSPEPHVVHGHVTNADAGGAGETGGGRLIAVGGPRGSGVTEVALGLAVALAGRRGVALLDAHDSAPSVAGRLGLPLEPNLHDAVDAAAHGLRPLDGCVVPILRAGRGRLVVVAGHPSPVAAAHVSTRDVLDVVAALLRCHDFVVVDVEDGSTTGRAILDDADAVVAVAGASPVGVVRVLEWIAGAAGRGSTTPLHLVVNRAPRSRFRQEEIRAEVERTVRPSSVSWLPHDRSVESAAWDGAPVPRGSFRKACARLGQAVDPAAGGGRRRAS